LAVKNTGTSVYNDSPANGTVVIDKDDQPYDVGDFSFVFTHEPDLGSPTIRPGDRRQGWMTFAIPEKTKLRTLQFTLDSGFGPETGEWNL
jgi:hypothetical protein